MKRFMITGILAVLVLALFASVASANAVLSTSGSGSPLANGTAVKIRASTNMTLAFDSSIGTVTCNTNLATPRYGSLGNGTITANTITGTSTAGTFTTAGSIAANGGLYFGNLMPNTQTTRSNCPTTIAATPNCAFQNVNALSIEGQIASNGSSADSGVNVRIGNSSNPVTVNAQCTPSSGGAAITCVYKSGTTSTNQLGVSGFAAYSGSPLRAGNLVFTNQPFYRDTTQSAGNCPATSSTAPARFSGTYQLFTTAGTQINAYQSSSKP